MKIDRTIIGILDAAHIDGNKLVLTGQLDRKTYEATNKVLDAIGGRWSRKDKAHVFPEPVAEVLEPILLTGEYSRAKQDFGQFDTPAELAERVVNAADVRPGMTVLEPSAGIGNIAAVARKFGGLVTCWEIDPKRAEKLEGIAHSLNIGDFLSSTPTPAFDRVVMNPPFAKQADIDHVRHALGFLRPSGRLAAIMSASVMFRENRKAVEFRDLVTARGGYMTMLPEGSFIASGTSVQTAMVALSAFPQPAGAET